MYPTNVRLPFYGPPGVDESSSLVPVFPVFLLQPPQLQVFLYTVLPYCCWSSPFFPRDWQVLSLFQVVVLLFSERSHTSEAGHFSIAFLFRQLRLPVTLPLCVMFSQRDVHRPSNHPHLSSFQEELLVSLQCPYLRSGLARPPCCRSDVLLADDSNHLKRYNLET